MTNKEKKRILISAANELAKYIAKANHDLKAGITATDLDDPDYHDFQTCDELLLIASEIYN